MAQNFLSDIKLGDSIYIRLGDGTNGDLRLYHDATHSYIDGANTGDLYIRSLSDDVVIQGADDVFIYTQGGEDAIIARGDAGVELFYNTSKKIETTNVGATITGALSITGGIITLGVADSSSGHINAYENMTFNIDTDNDDTNRYFAWYTNSSDGGGTELLKILETGNATFAGNVSVNAAGQKAVFHVKNEGNNWEDGVLLEHDSGDTGWNIHPENSSDNALWFGYNSDTSVALTSQGATAALKLNSDLSATFEGNINGKGYLNLQNGYGAANGIYLYGNPAMYRQDADTLYFPLNAATFAGTIASGNISVTGGSGGNGQIDVLRTSGANVRIQSQSATGVLGVTTNHPLHLKTNDTTRVTIAAGGDATFAGNVTASSGTGHFSLVNSSAYQLNGTYVMDSSRNLVNIGTITAAGTVTVGVDDTGYDVRFHGATAGKYMLWDESADRLEIVGEISISGDGSNDVVISESGSGHLTIDAPGNINLDADGGDINLKDGTTFWGQLTQDSSHFIMEAKIADKDIILRGTDNTTQIDALRLDMSEGGNASFSGNVDITGTDYLYLGSHVRINNPGSGVFKVGQYNGSAWTDTLSMTNAGAATFAGNIIVSGSTNRSIILDYTSGSGTYTWASFKQSGTEQFRIFGDYTSNYLSFYNDQASVHQLKLNSDGSTTFAGDVQAPGIYVGSTNTSYDFYNNGTSYLNGDVTFSGDNYHLMWDRSANALEFWDNAKLTFGDPGGTPDLEIYHDTSNNVIKNIAGNLDFEQHADNNHIRFYNDNGSGGVALYFHVDGSTHQTVFHKETVHVDDAFGSFGAGSDLKIHHDGTDSYIRNATGALYIQSEVTDGNIVFSNDDGTGGGTIAYFSVDGGSTTHDGSATTAMYTKWYDKSRIALGTGKDLQLYHDGSNSFMENGTGYLMLKSDTAIYLRSATGNEPYISCAKDGEVSLYYNDSLKFETTNTGVTVTGEEIVFKGSSPEFYFHTTGNHVNWLMAAQESTNACLEFSAVAASTSLSTTAGDYTPVLKLFQSGAATFAGDVTGNTGFYPDADGGAEVGNASLKFSGVYTNLLDAENIKVNGGQGSDGQVLTSTGSGVAWEAVNATFAGGTVTGDITIDKDAARLILQDDSTGNALNQWISYRDNDGTERAYVGYGSTSNSVFYVVNNLSDLKFYAGGVENSTMSGANTTFAGTITSTGLATFNDGITLGGSNETLKLLYNNTANYIGNLGWAYLQLGNNGSNDIVAGNTGAGGQFRFFVNNTNDIGGDAAPNGTLALTLASTGAATFGSSVDIGTFTIASSGIVADAGMTLQIGGGSVNAITLADSTGDATFAGDLYVPNKLIHVGDTNTWIQFETDVISLRTGGTDRLTLTDSTATFSGDVTITGHENTINIGAGGGVGTFTTSDTNDYPRITTPGASAQLGLFRSGSSVGGVYIGADSGGFDIRNASFATLFQVDMSGNVQLDGLIDSDGTGTNTFAGSMTVDGDITARSLTSHNYRGIAGSSTDQEFPIGHFNEGEEVFSIDPTWSNAQLQAFFGSSSVEWLEDSTAPSGWAIKLTNGVNVGGAYDSGFPYIAIEEDAIYYMECHIRGLDSDTSVNHYMGSIDYKEDFNCPSSGCGNPGSYGYWVMSNATTAGQTWTKATGIIRGSHNTSTGYFETGAKYWTPQALFNYSHGAGTRACVISGWRVVKISKQRMLADGAVGTPSLTFAEDQDTGLFRVGSNQLSLVTGGSKVLSLSNGKVGINTTDPDTAGYTYAEDLVILGGNSASDGAGITIACNGKTYGVLAFGDAADNNIGEIYYSHSDNSMNFRTNTNVGLRIDSSSNSHFTGGIHLSGTSDVFYTTESTDRFRIYDHGGYYLALGASGSVWTHFLTNASANYFDRPVVVDGGNIASYNENIEIRRDRSSSNALIMTGNGSGYLQPNTWIQFNGAGYGLYSATNGAHFYPNNGTSSYATWGISGSRNGYYGILMANIANKPHIMYDGSGNGGEYHEGNGTWAYYWHVSNACMGVGNSTTSSSYTIYSNGAIYSTADIVAYSDKRAKENIVTVDNALDKVSNLRGVYYNKKDSDEKKREVGVIAQEVKEVLPEVVTYDKENDQYGVDYGKINGLLIEAIKDLKKEIEELKQCKKCTDCDCNN